MSEPVRVEAWACAKCGRPYSKREDAEHCGTLEAWPRRSVGDEVRLTLYEYEREGPQKFVIAEIKLEERHDGYWHHPASYRLEPTPRGTEAGWWPEARIMPRRPVLKMPNGETPTTLEDALESKEVWEL